MSTQNGKCGLVLKEPPMTVIAAMRESEDSLLIAVDSQYIEMPGKIPFATDTKLQSHPSFPLAWGVADNSTIGNRFSEKVKKLQLSSANWNDVEDELNRELSTLNAKQRAFSKRAGVNSLPGELASVLAIGFVGAEGRIFEIDDRGMVTVMPHGFHVIGSGKVYATSAYKMLTYLPTHATVEEKLKAITAVTAEMVESCGPHVHWGRVTPNSFTLLG